MTKAWLITGVSSGLGKLLAEKALERGDRVIGTSRSAGTLGDLRKRYPEQLRVAALNLKDPGLIRAMVDRAFGELGRIDVVSNAGYGVLGAAEETTDVQMRNVVATNLLGSIALIRAALPHLRRQGGGRILQVSSEGGQIAYPGFIYHAAKWGIEGFVKAAAQEVEGFGIAFTLGEPGPARTDFSGNLVQPEPLAAYAGTPAHRLRDAALRGSWVIKGDPDRMTDAMIRLAISKARFGDGWCSAPAPMAGFVRHSPVALQNSTIRGRSRSRPTSRMRNWRGSDVAGWRRRDARSRLVRSA